MMVFSGRDLKTVTSVVKGFASLLRRKSRRQKDMQILGPAPAPLSRIKNRYRWQLLVKTKNVLNASSLIKAIMEEEKNSKKKSSVRMAVNVDPMEML
jgi:primosomal protein N' (replication factor Y)